MKKQILLSASLIAMVGLAVPAQAKEYTRYNDETNTWERVTDAVTDLLVGEDDVHIYSETEGRGNANALNQIEKNIDKHGGSHYGLENARSKKLSKSGTYYYDLDRGLLGDVADSVSDSIENDVEASGKIKSRKGFKIGQGRGHNK